MLRAAQRTDGQREELPEGWTVDNDDVDDDDNDDDDDDGRMGKEEK